MTILGTRVAGRNCKQAAVLSLLGVLVVILSNFNFAIGQTTPKTRAQGNDNGQRQTPEPPTPGGPPRSGTRGPERIGPRASDSVAPPVNQLPGAARQVSGITQLSVEQAIQLAVENNVATLLAKERRREAEGLKRQSLSRLLPNISGTAYQASLTENLAALGFQGNAFPGLATFVGPFNNFDARARLTQTIFDLSALRNYRAGQAGVRAAEYEESLAREQVATVTTLLYLEALRSDRAVLAAQANITLAEALLTLAQDQRTAGVATGLDVARAETRLAEERVRQSQAETAAEEARLNLQRVVGVTMGTTLTLTDTLRFTNDAVPAADLAVTQAVTDRAEVLLAEAEIRESQLARAAVRAEYLPSLEFVGDYGVSGITPTDAALPTRRAAIQLNVPVFNGGLTQGRVAVATSRERQAELQLGNVRGQVEEDVRLALVTLRTAAVQVAAADESMRLAERELEMSRDRFRAGVTDNLEVITALTAVANAREAQTNALARYNVARVNLAAALGHAQTFHW